VTLNAWRAVAGAAGARPPGAPARGARSALSGVTQKQAKRDTGTGRTHPAAAARRAAHSDGVQLAACMAATVRSKRVTEDGAADGFLA
jgi:pyruvate/2-oxoglutarate dehydrogenase complex dihydrolipoamide acyltransferase (E2) component